MAIWNSLAEDGKDVTHFVFHLGVIANRVGNDLAEQFAITLAQPQHGHFDRALAHAEARRDFRIRVGVWIAEQIHLQGFEPVRVTVCLALRFKPIEHAVQKRHGPAAFEDAFGIERVCRFKFVAFLCFGGVEGNGRLSAAAFEGVGLLPFVAKVMVEGGAQERAEAAFFAPHLSEFVAVE